MIDQKKLSDFKSFTGLNEDDLFIENKFSLKQEKKRLVDFL